MSTVTFVYCLPFLCVYLSYLFSYHNYLFVFPTYVSIVGTYVSLEGTYLAIVGTYGVYRRYEIMRQIFSGPMRFGSSHRRNDERVDLKTKYFQITERNDISIRDVPDKDVASDDTSSTSRPGSRVPVLVKKLAKIPIMKPTSELTKNDKSKIANIPANVISKNATDLCRQRPDVVECDETSKTSKTAIKANLLPASFEPLLKHLRGEIWVVPVLVASGSLAIILIVFEIYLVSQVVRSSRRHQYPSRRHLFLGQMLIIGLLLCCTAAVVYTLKPTVAVCSVTRVATGVAYSVVYATLLVKLVFLISLNSGVYLPATYQSLLLCFAVLIQLVSNL